MEINLQEIISEQTRSKQTFANTSWMMARQTERCSHMSLM